MPHQSAQVLLLINSPLLRIMYNYNHIHYNHNGVGSYQINYYRWRITLGTSY